MGVPLNLGDIYSGFFSADAYNANNTLIEEAVGKALDRTGATDNSMEVPLDMGLNNIFNLKSALLSHQAVPLQQLMSILNASIDDVTSLVTMEDRYTAVGGETVIPFTQITYTPLTNSLMVFKNGEYQRATFEYSESGTTEITFTNPLAPSDIVDVFGSKYDAQQYVDLAIKAAASAEQSKNDSAQSAYNADQSAQAAASAAGYKLDINDQTGITYTLQLTDEGDFVRMDNPADNSLIVPPDSSVDFEIGTIILVRQVGAGTTTIQPAIGVTINSPFNSYSISEADFGIALVKIAANTWDMIKSFGGVDSSDLVAFTQEFDTRLQGLFNELLSADPTFVVNFDALQNQTNSAILQIQNEFDVLEGNVNNSVGNITSAFGQMQIDFNFIDQQFNIIDQAFAQIQPDFIDIQIAFGLLEGRMNSIENQWTGIDGRMDDIQDSLDLLNIGAGSFASSLSTNGYQVLPSGLIMQWGKTTLNTGTPSGSRIVSFPIPFPNSCLNVSATYAAQMDRDGDSIWVSDLTPTTFNIRQQGDSSRHSYWFAVGY